MTTTKGKNASKLIKNFIKNLKKNTSAMRRLKRAYELHSNKNSIHELIKIINEKLDVVHKIRNDIKMYRTVNTVLTNHYIRETRDRERDIGGRMIDLEEQILRAYEGLRSDIMKIVASDRNVIAVTNNMYRNNEASDKKQIYDGIIRRIDGLFTGAVSLTVHCIHRRYAHLVKKKKVFYFDVPIVFFHESFYASQINIKFKKVYFFYLTNQETVKCESTLGVFYKYL